MESPGNFNLHFSVVHQFWFHAQWPFLILPFNNYSFHQTFLKLLHFLVFYILSSLFILDSNTLSDVKLAATFSLSMAVSSLVCPLCHRKSFNFLKAYLSVVSITSWVTEVPLRKCLLRPQLSSVFLSFSSNSLRLSGFVWRPLILLELIPLQGVRWAGI